MEAQGWLNRTIAFGTILPEGVELNSGRSSAAQDENGGHFPPRRDKNGGHFPPRRATRCSSSYRIPVAPVVGIAGIHATGPTGVACFFLCFPTGVASGAIRRSFVSGRLVRRPAALPRVFAAAAFASGVAAAPALLCVAGTSGRQHKGNAQ